MDELPGRMINGRYRIERKLGEGAAGVVWLARDTREKGQVWALKELDFNGIASTTERAEALDLFERESDILMQLRHEALPRVLERFSESGHEFLVMERVEGPTLDQVLNGRRDFIPESDVAAWCVRICDVLEYLHSCNPPVVYRDLKPSNVMLGVDGRIKLIDFGIARPLNPQRPGDTVAYGTPGYAPTEQYMGKAVPASDIYALGITMFQLLTRVSPEKQGLAFKVTSVRLYNAQASVEMDDIVSACTRREAALRPNAGEVRACLKNLPGPTPRTVWRALIDRWMGR